MQTQIITDQTQQPTHQIMKDRLADYLIELSLNPRKRQAFHENPQFALNATQLSSAERDIILCGDSKKIYQAFGDEKYIYAAAVVVVIVIVNFWCGDN